MSQIVVVPQPNAPPVVVRPPAPITVEVSNARVVEVAYTHRQNVASNTWTVTHDLTFYPGGIMVFDSAGSLWIPDRVTHLNTNSLIINFGTLAFAGVAYIS